MLRQIILTLTSLILLTSCLSDNGHDGPVDMICWDIATFNGNINDKAQFTIRQVNDLPEATLIAQTAIKTGDKDMTGKRMLISYIPEDNKPYTSGPITLYSAAAVNQSPTKIESMNDYTDWNRDPVYLYSAWRTGTYLNFHVALTYDKEPRVFRIVVDETTVGNDYPDLYLVHIMNQVTDYHDRRYYASFDISEIWNRDNVCGVRLHVANSNLVNYISTPNKIN